MGDGRNGNREPSKVGAELFGLEQAKPRNHDCDGRKLPPDLRQHLPGEEG